MRQMIDPPLARLALGLAAWKVSAHALTLAAFVLALGAAWAIVEGRFALALFLFLSSRVCDGLDGAVARARNQASDAGGYFDIVTDLIGYAALAAAFGWADPAHAPAALLLLVSFMATASSFLAYAILAAKHGRQTEKRGRKSFFHAAGLAEGTETILFFCAAMIWPHAFAPLAYGFAFLCFVTALARSRAAWMDFRS